MNLNKTLQGPRAGIAIASFPPSYSLLLIPSSLFPPPPSPPPQDDRYFLSGSLDGKLRLWNIPDKRVALWNEIESVGETMGERAGDGLEMSCDIT